MHSAAHSLMLDDAHLAAFDAQFSAAVPRATAADPSMLAVQWVNSPVGALLIGATGGAFVLLEFCDLDALSVRLARIGKHFGQAPMRADRPLLDRARLQLAEYFAGTRRDFDLPLEFHGTAFQERVWSALRRIPYGETCSYGAIAQQLEDRNAMRAVGMANGANPIAIVIPCHRVVNASGDLGGFGGGLRRKQILLDLERGQASLF